MIVFEALTGTGLAASAGLNAYIPLLALGLLARYTDAVTLPSDWQWLSNGWVIAILAALLVIEVVADKVPVLDHINDTVQTFIRPAAGGLVFGAGSSSETVTVSDPEQFFSSAWWVPVAVGVLIALAVHALKAAARVLVNTLTVGIGAPAVSTVEDATSVVMSVVAILLPVLVLLFLLGMVVLAFWLIRRRRLRKREQPPALPDSRSEWPDPERKAARH